MYTNFVTTVAQARGKTEQEVKDVLDAGIYETSKLVDSGWLDGGCGRAGGVGATHALRRPPLLTCGIRRWARHG